MIPRLLISIGVSAGLVGLLIHFVLSSTEPALWSRLVAILLSFSMVYAIIYFVLSLIRTALQAVRFRVLLRASTPRAPSLFHMYLVTLSRNMFVDMLPARLGELSYIAMLNRGCRVSGESCVSSLAVSFVFDLIALGVLLVLLLCAQVVGGDYQSWMAGVLVMLGLLIFFLLVLLYPAMKMVNAVLARVELLRRGFAGNVLDFLVRVEQALEDSRRAGITGRLLLLSVGVRAVKYLALYVLFVGVAATQFQDVDTAVAHVLPALISAEAGASLPVPAFMGFGTYEAAGTLALTVLGASAANSLIILLALHVVSQIIDYLLGGIGLILFILTTGKTGKEDVRRFSWKLWVPALTVAVCAALFLVYQMRAVSKRGTLLAPDSGRAVASLAAADGNVSSLLDGFVVWSSNRSGNHDIYLRSFPDGALRQLTAHPHTEYFPRISPDGKRIVFARAHQPWVSQRNVYAWDVWMLDLDTGQERMLAKNGNVPTWSTDGETVYFQRNANQVVSVGVETHEERVLYESGVNVDVVPETELQTPDIASDGRLAVTLRKTMRATAVVDSESGLTKTGNGCQLVWTPGERFLLKIDGGGRGQNAVYRINARTFEQEQLFDAPGEFSHEYFPMLSNHGDVLVFGASSGGHEHDTADYEIFAWVVGSDPSDAVRLTHHTGNDCWPDIYSKKPVHESR